MRQIKRVAAIAANKEIIACTTIHRATATTGDESIIPPEASIHHFVCYRTHNSIVAEVGGDAITLDLIVRAEGFLGNDKISSPGLPKY